LSLYDHPGILHWVRDPFWGAMNHVGYHAMRLVPARSASGAGRRLGIAAGRYRFRNLNEICHRNLQHILPGSQAAERAQIVARMWENLGRTLAETAVIERLWESARITVVNDAAVMERLRTGQPIVFVFPHLGNWELLAIAVQRMGVKLNVVFERLRNRFVRSLAERSRRRLGYRLIAPDRGGIRGMLAALGRGEAVGMAMDEHRNGNVIAPAFGRPLPAAANLRYAVKLARQFDVPVLACYCARSGPLEFTLTFHDPIERASVERLNDLCETWIRAHPEQWYMLHRLRFA
jgi:KDO2-lipid IV(A) lauroyltransferase